VGNSQIDSFIYEQRLSPKILVKELDDGLELWGKKHCFEKRFPAFTRFDFFEFYCPTWWGVKISI
ncbi:MAG: hypothetical protein LBR51_06545, partial [Bacteroidales bacterium]|nr:hypothetical protein [Bacteroidales bacterium]